MVNVPGEQAGVHFCPEGRGDGTQLKGRGAGPAWLAWDQKLPTPLRLCLALTSGLCMHIEMAPTVKLTARSVPLEGFWGLGALGLNYSEVDIVNSFFCLFVLLVVFMKKKKKTPKTKLSRAINGIKQHLSALNASVLETQGMWVLSLGQEDPLEEEMATHSRILAWRIPRTEEPGGLQFIESQRVRHEWSDVA